MAAFSCEAGSGPDDQGGGPEAGCGGSCREPRKTGEDLVQGARGVVDLGRLFAYSVLKGIPSGPKILEARAVGPSSRGLHASPGAPSPRWPASHPAFWPLSAPALPFFLFE